MASSINVKNWAGSSSNFRVKAFEASLRARAAYNTFAKAQAFVIEKKGTNYYGSDAFLIELKGKVFDDLMDPKTTGFTTDEAKYFVSRFKFEGVALVDGNDQLSVFTDNNNSGVAYVSLSGSNGLIDIFYNDVNLALNKPSGLLGQDRAALLSNFGSVLEGKSITLDGQSLGGTRAQELGASLFESGFTIDRVWGVNSPGAAWGHDEEVLIVMQKCPT